MEFEKGLNFDAWFPYLKLILITSSKINLKHRLENVGSIGSLDEVFSCVVDFLFKLVLTDCDLRMIFQEWGIVRLSATNLINRLIQSFPWDDGRVEALWLLIRSI